MRAPWASLLSLLVLVGPREARAQPAAPTLTFRQAVDAAWARLPQRQDFAARQTEAAARDASGRALFPNAPYTTGSYVNDKVAGSNLNYITAEGELSTPVWLPGEGRATRNIARADTAAIDADADAAHLDVAVQVLAASQQAALAANTLDVAQRQAQAAQSLAGHVNRRFQLGESAESDFLAASAEAAQARISLAAAQAQLATARADLTALTGEESVPSLAAPRRAGIPQDDSVLARHPRLVAAERAVAAAQATARLTRIENRDSPEVGVQAIDEKQPGTRWDTRVGLVFRLPFATAARNAPRRAADEAALTHAYVLHEVARRQVLTELHSAEAELAGAEAATEAASEASRALARRRGQIERAWEAGEMSLVEVVRANATAFGAELAGSKAATDLQAARWRLLLTEGETP